MNSPARHQLAAAVRIALSRVICAGDAPDHCTLSRFVADCRDAVADLFTQVLKLCVRAGLGRPRPRQSPHPRRPAPDGATVEPVIGQIKDVTGLRRFRSRGLAAVRAEFTLTCTVHNLLELHRAHTAPAAG